MKDSGLGVMKDEAFGDYGKRELWGYALRGL